MSHGLKPLTKEHNIMMNAIYANIEKFDTEKHLPEFNQIIRVNKYYKLKLINSMDCNYNFLQRKDYLFY